MLGTGQRVGLDNIVYRLVRHAPNGVSSLELARRMGMEHEELLRASDPADKKRKFDVEKLELLMHHSGGGSVVAEYLAEIAGGTYKFLAQPHEKYLAIGREPLRGPPSGCGFRLQNAVISGRPAPPACTFSTVALESGLPCPECIHVYNEEN